MKKRPTTKYIAVLALIILFIFALISIQEGSKSGSILATIIEIKDQFTNFLLTIPPSIYFISFIILPAFGVPLSLFYLTSLSVFSTLSTEWALALSLVALGGNITFCRLLTLGVFEPIIKKILKKRNLSKLSFTPQSEWKIVFTFRISPLPFVLQNYLLAFAKTRWRYYLGLSWIIQGLIGTGVMLVGESLFKGGLSYALLGLFIIISFYFIINALKKKFSTEKNAHEFSSSQ